MDFIEKNKRIVKSSSVKIGKRTYFFDVKSTTNGDYYLVITESVRTSINIRFSCIKRTFINLFRHTEK